MHPASMLTGSADCKASVPANLQGTASRPIEGTLVTQLLNLHVVWTGFLSLRPDECGECLTVISLLCTGPTRREAWG